MALTNINNLGGIDALDNLNAADETFIIEGLRNLLLHNDDPRFAIELFVGQMAAEGFANAGMGAVRAVVESPTVRVQFIQTGANMTKLVGYVKVDSTWMEVTTCVVDGQMSAAGA